MKVMINWLDGTCSEFTPKSVEYNNVYVVFKTGASEYRVPWSAVRSIEEFNR